MERPIRDNIIALHTKPGTIEWTQSNLSSPPTEWVCVRYLYCGICGGDYSVYLGNRKHAVPLSLGHEFVGQVIDIGDTVDSLRLGDFVVSDLNYRCGKCEYCLQGRSHLCINNAIGHFTNRGFAAYANIHAGYLIPIDVPDYLPRACLIEPLSCVLHACQNISFKSSDSILICGGGSIGALFCFYFSRIAGLKNLTVYEKLQTRQTLLKNRFQINILHDNIIRNYDWIIDSSNTLSGLQYCLNLASLGGRLCIMSHLYDMETSFVYETICRKELHCEFPLRNGQRENLETAARYIAQFWTDEDDVLLRVYDNIEDAFRFKETSPSCKQIVKAPVLG